jgi:micrococcal nuclease
MWPEESLDGQSGFDMSLDRRGARCRPGVPGTGPSHLRRMGGGSLFPARLIGAIALLLIVASCASPVGTPTSQIDGPSGSPTVVAGLTPTPVATSGPPRLPPIRSTGSPVASGSTPVLLERPNDLPTGRVVRVVDGDTVDVVLDGRTERVRLIGIDTPEPTDPDANERCWADRATVRARELLDGKTLWLEDDPSQDDRDRFGRLLRYLWLPDGHLFNHLMVAEGLAREYTFRLPYRYQAAFKEAEERARSQERAIWSAHSCVEPTRLPAATAPVGLPTERASPGASPGSGLTLVEVVGGPPRSTARVVARTSPSAQCSISYRTPAGTPSTAQGLIPKTADSTGQVSWSWVIGSSTRPGIGRVTVTCDGISASAPITIE